MSIRRVGVLLGKEVSQGWRNVIFIFAVVVPVVLTVLVSLLFGTIFSGKARLGLADEGASGLPGRASALVSLDTHSYASPAALRAATADGMVDVGVVLPAGFDGRVKTGERAQLTAYVWGESSMRNRAVASAALANLIREMTGQGTPVEILSSTVGPGSGLPWEARLLPFVVMMAMIFGGSVVPAASLVEEKQRRTLRAVITTPASLGEVFAAKGVLGGMLGIVMAIVTLVLNRAWGPEPALLLLALALGAVMAACAGILIGAFVRDISSMLAVIKGGVLLLYAPAIIYMFPEIPQWLGRLFPTYYLIQPVVEIIQQAGGWAEVAPELIVLAGLDAILIAIIAVVVHRAPETEGALNPT